MSKPRRLWWLLRPLVWRWRLRYWDLDALRVALYFAFVGRAPRVGPRVEWPEERG